MNGWKDFKTEDKRFTVDSEVMEVVQSWLKAITNSFFSRGHPQGCGHVDKVCSEAGGLCQKMRHKQFL
jgi:hypothetical protein